MLGWRSGSSAREATGVDAVAFPRPFDVPGEPAGDPEWKFRDAVEGDGGGEVFAGECEGLGGVERGDPANGEGGGGEPPPRAPGDEGGGNRGGQAGEKEHADVAGWSDGAVSGCDPYLVRKGIPPRNGVAIEEDHGLGEERREAFGREAFAKFVVFGEVVGEGVPSADGCDVLAGHADGGPEGKSGFRGGEPGPEREESGGAVEGFGESGRRGEAVAGGHGHGRLEPECEGGEGGGTDPCFTVEDTPPIMGGVRGHLEQLGDFGVGAKLAGAGDSFEKRNGAGDLFGAGIGDANEGLVTGAECSGGFAQDFGGVGNSRFHRAEHRYGEALGGGYGGVWAEASAAEGECGPKPVRAGEKANNACGGENEGHGAVVAGIGRV